MHQKVRKILQEAEKRAEKASKNVNRVEKRSLKKRIEKGKKESKNPVIAEIKPTSPTTNGKVRRDPVDVANQAVESGAVGLSVLTEPTYFGGSIETLKKVRSSVEVPILRKDFIIDERQLYQVESDAVLLIAAFIDDLKEMVDRAVSLGFEPLVETHTKDELEKALNTQANIVGVNNRDLKRLKVDLSVCEKLLPQIPDDRKAIAESGISSSQDAVRMFEAGADGILVGTAIMQQPEEKTRELTNAKTD